MVIIFSLQFVENCFGSSHRLCNHSHYTVISSSPPKLRIEWPATILPSIATPSSHPPTLVSRSQILKVNVRATCRLLLLQQDWRFNTSWHSIQFTVTSKVTDLQVCNFLWSHVESCSPVEWFFCSWRYNPLWACILQPSSGAVASSRTRFLDHTQRRTTVGRTPLDERSVCRRDPYLTTHNTHNKHPRPRWDSNPWSQQASGRRPTP